LELNAIPGFTTRSDLPKAAAKTGVSMRDLCAKIIGAALENKNNPGAFVNPAMRNKR
jgi:hypothetical protein